MTRVVELLLRTGLLLGLVGAIGQLVLMILDLFRVVDLRWYWGGAIAYFSAPVAFALMLRLLEERPKRVIDNA
jgi:hypothetical protein